MNTNGWEGKTYFIVPAPDFSSALYMVAEPELYKRRARYASSVAWCSPTLICIYTGFKRFKVMNYSHVDTNGQLEENTWVFLAFF